MGWKVFHGMGARMMDTRDLAISFVFLFESSHLLSCMLDETNSAMKAEPPKDPSSSYSSSHVVTAIAEIVGCGCGRVRSLLFAGGIRVRVRRWQ